MIRVLIERRLAPGKEAAFYEAMREIRKTAVHRPGYISGETLRDTSDPLHCVVLSTWQSARDWEAWLASESRQRVLRELAPMLREPERLCVLEPT